MTQKSNKELILGQYQQLAKLGSGTFGNVYKCLDLKSGDMVAIKKMKKVYNNQEEAFGQREIQVLQQFNHPNLVHARRIELDGGRLYIVFEHLDMNLTDFMKEKMKTDGRKLSEDEIRIIMKQVLIGLDYMHGKGFLHRDIKPENFIIGMKSYEVKMIDFGTVRDIGNSQPPFTTYVSTRWYRSPEVVLRCHNYGPQSDIFAAGCVMAELFTTQPLFPGGSEMDQIDTILKIMGTPSQQKWRDGYKLAQKRNIQLDQMMYKKQPLNKIIPNVSKEGLYIMKKMLKVDPNKRFSAKKLLGEPYFQSIHLRTMIEKIKNMSPHIRTIEVQSDYPKSEGKHDERIKRQEQPQRPPPNKKKSNSNLPRSGSVDLVKQEQVIPQQKQEIQKLTIKKRNTESSTSIQPQIAEPKVEYYPNYNYQAKASPVMISPIIKNPMKKEIEKQKSRQSLKEEKVASDFASYNIKINPIDQGEWSKGSQQAFPLRKDQPLSFAERVDKELRRSTQVTGDKFQYNFNGTSNNNPNSYQSVLQEGISSPQFYKNNSNGAYDQKPDTGQSMLARVASQGILNQAASHDAFKKDRHNMNLSVKIEKNMPQTLTNSPMFSPLQPVGLRSVTLKNKLDYLGQDNQFLPKSQQQEEKIEPFLIRNDSFGLDSGGNQLNWQKNNSSGKTTHPDQFFNFSQRQEIFSPFGNHASPLHVQLQDSNDSNEQQNILNKYTAYYQTSQSQQSSNKSISPSMGQIYGRSSLNQVDETREEHINQDYYSHTNNQKVNPSSSNSYRPTGEQSKSPTYHKGTTFINNATNIFNSPSSGLKQILSTQNNSVSSSKFGGSELVPANTGDIILNSVLNRYKVQIHI